MKCSKSQIYILVAAGLFIIGAVFMLINTFANIAWALWTGLGVAIAATVFYILVVIENRKETKKNLEDTQEKPSKPKIKNDKVSD